MPKSARPQEKPTAAAVADILTRRKEESVMLLEYAEEVYGALARDEMPSTEDRQLLVSMGVVGDRLTAEVVRKRQVNHHQSLAGTTPQREESRRAAETAAAERDQRIPEIEQQKAELEREEATLKAAAERARKLCERQAAAVEMLRHREVLPEHVRQEYDAVCRQYRDQYSPKLAALRHELELSAKLAGLPVEDPAVLAHAQPMKLTCFVPAPVGSGENPHVDRNGWKQYIDERQAEDEHRRAELERLEAEAQPLVARREELLSYYVR